MDNNYKKFVVHCKKSKYDVYCGRPSKWGNPFEIGRDGTRDEVIAKYEEYLLSDPVLMNSLHELTNRVLSCWCRPMRCHADILAKYANNLDKLDTLK